MATPTRRGKDSRGKVSEAAYAGQAAFTPMGRVRCEAAKKDGMRCGRSAVDGKVVCMVHGGGKDSGGVPGNRNGLRHGLFTRAFGSEALNTFNEVMEANPQELMKRKAALILTRIDLAHRIEDAMDPVMRELLPTLEAMVKAGTLSKDQVRDFLKLHNAPSLDTLAKVATPLKQLLSESQAGEQAKGFAEVLALANQRLTGLKAESKNEDGNGTWEQAFDD